MMEVLRKKSIEDVNEQDLLSIEGGFAQVAVAGAGFSMGALAASAVIGVGAGVLAAVIYDEVFGEEATADCDDTSASAGTGGSRCDCDKTPTP